MVKPQAYTCPARLSFEISERLQSPSVRHRSMCLRASPSDAATYGHIFRFRGGRMVGGLTDNLTYRTKVAREFSLFSRRSRILRC